MDDSVISCPPCRSPERCLQLGGACGMTLDKLKAIEARTYPYYRIGEWTDRPSGPITTDSPLTKRDGNG